MSRHDRPDTPNTLQGASPIGDVLSQVFILNQNGR